MAFQKQVGEADYTVERGTDFMGHVGQKFRFYAARLQRFLACQIQLDILNFDGFKGFSQVFSGLVHVLL